MPVAIAVVACVEPEVESSRACPAGPGGRGQAGSGPDAVSEDDGTRQREKDASARPGRRLPRERTRVLARVARVGLTVR